MKITKIEQKIVNDPSINISYCFEGSKVFNVSLEWTCSKCGGYGCNRNHDRSNCDDHKKIYSLKDLKDIFGIEAAEDFKYQILKFLGESNDI